MLPPCHRESLNGLLLLGRRTPCGPTVPQVQEVALAAALSSAAGVAVSTSLQHEQAGAAPSRAAGTAHLLAHLVRRPRWIAAQLVSLASFCLHAVALRYGSLALVQPVVVSGMVLAVPVRAALSRRPPRLDELCSALLTGAGLTILLLASGPVPPSADVATADLRHLGLTGAGLVAAAATQYAGTRCTTRQGRARVLGVAAGILFGLAAGLLKLVTSEVEAHGVLAALGGWAVWALLIAGIGGSAINQSAYRAGSLSASMPLLNVADVLVSLGFGVVALGELPAHSPAALVAQVCALGCVAAGLWARGSPDPSARVRRGVTRATRSARAPVPDSRHGQQRAVRRTRGQRNARRR